MGVNSSYNYSQIGEFDIEGYLLNFIFQEKAQSIFDIFTSLFGIRIAFFSPSGDEIKVGRNKPICQYCRLQREKEDFNRKCLSLDQKMRLKAAKQKQMVVYRCHSGMTEVVTPLYLEEDLVGFVMIGQFRISEQSIDQKIFDQWKQEIGTSELEDAYNDTPAFSEAHAKDVLELFHILIEFIVSKHLISVKSKSAIHGMIEFLKKHVENNLSIENAAELVYLSKSSFYHKFKKCTGQSFKQYQIDLKLAKADDYFQRNPELTIKEVASKLGYQDPFYFSRLYKKHRKMTPAASQKNKRQ